MRNPRRTAYDSPTAQYQKILYVLNIQQNNWVSLCLENSRMKNRGQRIFSWNILFFLQASSKLNWASIKLNLKPNFLNIYLTNPYDVMLEILFRTSLLFWYVKILLRSFSFWDIENVKAKFQLRHAYELYAYKKRVYDMWKKVIDYCEN